MKGATDWGLIRLPKVQILVSCFLESREVFCHIKNQNNLIILHTIWGQGLCIFCEYTVWPCIALHYNDVIMSSTASQITSLTIVYSTVYSGADQRKHQSSASLAFVRGIHRSPVNCPHKGPVKRKMLPFDDVIMLSVTSDVLIDYSGRFIGVIKLSKIESSLEVDG